MSSRSLTSIGLPGFAVGAAAVTLLFSTHWSGGEESRVALIALLGFFAALVGAAAFAALTRRNRTAIVLAIACAVVSCFALLGFRLL